MEKVVQKFGGTSLDSQEKRIRAARIIKRTFNNGLYPVVVVSAIGRQGKPYATDTLIKIAREAYYEINPREKDLLMSCGEVISAVIMVQTLKKYNIKAAALTGAQAGILTDSHFGESTIKSVNPEKINNLIRENIVPIIAGFQGITAQGEITTLGRGGSDTTAAVIAAALDAQNIEIYTDVDGVMTADPEVVTEARTLSEVSYNEVCELAYQGARVLHPRAAEIAMQEDIPIKVKSIVSGNTGTTIRKSIDSDRPVTGVTSRRDIVFIRIKDGEDSLDVFKIMAGNNISVDFINTHPGAVSFIIKDSCRERAGKILQDRGFSFQLSDEFVKISVIGGGMTGRPGIMAKIVEALSKEKISIYQTTDSHTVISCLLKKEMEKMALNALHRAFALNT